MKIKNMLLTAVCIYFLCLLGSMQVYAAEYYGNFQYEDNGENVSIYAYNGSDKEVTIPAYINDKAVTEINDYAFLLCNSVEKIIVPSTVTTIHANAFSGAGNLKNVVLASSDTKIEDSNEKVDKKDTDENGKSDPSDATDNKNGHNSGNKDAGNANPSGTSNNQTKEQSGANNNQSNYKVTVDSSVDTAAEEKKLAEQYKKENKTDDGATAQNGDTEKQSGGTEIAGIDEGIDADENTIGSNADTASEKSQSMPVRGIILIVIAAAIAVTGMALFIRKKKKQK
ncbi:MAG: leucine-rich repeat protein [Clostridium sp.]